MTWPCGANLRSSSAQSEEIIYWCFRPLRFRLCCYMAIDTNTPSLSKNKMATRVASEIQVDIKHIFSMSFRKKSRDWGIGSYLTNTSPLIFLEPIIVSRGRCPGQKYVPILVASKELDQSYLTYGRGGSKTRLLLPEKGRQDMPSAIWLCPPQNSCCCLIPIVQS